MPAAAILALVLILTPQQTPDTDEPVVVVGIPEAAPTPAPTPSPSPTPAVKTKKRKTEAKLSCSPPISISGGLTPSLITASLFVEQPGERLWCPGIEWYIGSQYTGAHESDCLPYETVVAGEGEPERWTEDHPRFFRLWQGEHTIKAKLVKAGKVLASAECRVMVR